MKVKESSKSMLDSYFYRKKLKRNKSRLKKYLYIVENQEDFEDDVFSKIEECLFIAFYYIRKMIECNKIRTEDTNFNVNLYIQNTNPEDKNSVSFYSGFTEYYQKEKKKTTLNIKDICDLFVHNFILHLDFNEKIIIYFNSFNKKYFLFSIKSDDIFCIFDRIINSHITSEYREFKDGKIKISSK